MMKNWCIYDKETKELVACINSDNKDHVLKSNLDIKFYNDTDPVFVEKETGLYINLNSFTIEL